MSEITAVGKLESTYPAFVASLDYLLRHLRVFMVEHRHHASLTDFCHYGQFIEF